MGSNVDDGHPAEKFTVTQYSHQVDLIAKDPVIAEVQAKLRALVATEAFVPSKPTRLNWPLNEQLRATAAKAFRRQYLHLSMDVDKTGMAPRYNEQHQLERRHEPG